MIISKRNKNYKRILICTVILLYGILSCDKEVSRSPVESEAPKGFIYVDSNPQGFAIFLNDRNTGRITPDSISYIEADKYIIKLKKQYFKDTSVVVLLEENEKRNVFVDIFSNPSMYGNLILTSVPIGASITLNDSLLIQATPFTIQNLWPGEYSIKFSLYNYRSVSFLAIAESEKSKNYTQTLRDTSVWVDYQSFNSGIQTNSLTAITFDQNNVKWIGTLDKGLIRFDEVNFINYNTSNSQIPSNRINYVCNDPTNRVWIGTDAGIGIFDGITWTIYNSQNSELTSETINTINFETNGTAWIGTTANLVKFDGINWSVFDEPSGWGDWIKAIYIETENILWLGTLNNGIYKFENEIFVRLLQPEYGYLSNTISSIDNDQNNNLWFCFLPDTAGGGGTSYWDGSVFQNYFLGSTQINVNDVLIDDEDNKWFATSEGFIKFDAQNNSTVFRTYNSLISSNITLSCIRDLNGNVWVTTFASGLNKYKPPQ